ncbi:MAG: hypothetical protein KatS3mg057_1023 [Herpetosiphonaceae bacterium]|nr:MAG: hypothetical protein KatS3mg057_1023 [Herpetosiphonaceae bacterium]
MESIGGISGDVWTGRFDYTLLKPVQTQFLVSFQRWSLWSMIDLLLSMIVLGAGIRQLSAQLTQAAIGTFVLNLMVSMIILYSLSLLLTSATFWFQGIPLLGAFISFFQLSRYPVGIYPGWLKLVLTWVLPVGFVTTVPVEMLTRQASVYILVLGGLLA